MGIWIMAVCDGPDYCSASWTGDDVDLENLEEHAAPFRDVAEYLSEHEEWAVDGGKILCPDHKPKEDSNE